MIAAIFLCARTLARCPFVSRAEEKAVFDALCAAHPDFVGVGVVWQEGPDPPDLIGTDGADRRIGVELGEWLNEEQMREGKRQERAEDSFLNAIRSEDEAPPGNIGCIWLSLAHERSLPVEEAEQFRAEILECLHVIDRSTIDWTDPQGYDHSDFSSFPCLQRHLTGIHVRSASQIPAYKGGSLIGFPPKGGAYTPKSALDALLKLLRKRRLTSMLACTRQRTWMNCALSLTGIRV